jgi:hypothetical protein
MTGFQDRGRGLRGLLGEHLRDHDRIGVHAIDNAPSDSLGPSPATRGIGRQFQASVANAASRVPFPAGFAKKIAGSDPRRLPEGRSPNLAWSQASGLTLRAPRLNLCQF